MAVSGLSARKLAMVLVAALACFGCKARDPLDTSSQPPSVKVAVAGAASLANQLDLPGIVIFRRETVLSFATDGQLTQVTVNDGDRVAKGQVLAILDPTVAAAQLASAAADRQKAEASFARIAQLRKDGWIAAPSFDAAQAELVRTRSVEQAAAFRARHARIRAPSGGVIVARLAEQGQYVGAGLPIIGFGSTRDGLAVRFALSESDLRKFAVGQAVSIETGAPQAPRLTGRVFEIAGRADQGSGTFAVKVSLPAAAAVQVGQSVRGQFLLSDRQLQVTVPMSALHYPRASTGFVYVLDRARAVVRTRRVTFGQVGNDGTVPVLSGLRPGETVVVSTMAQLRDGDKVVISQ